MAARRDKPSADVEPKPDTTPAEVKPETKRTPRRPVARAGGHTDWGDGRGWVLEK